MTADGTPPPTALPAPTADERHRYQAFLRDGPIDGIGIHVYGQGRDAVDDAMVAAWEAALRWAGVDPEAAQAADAIHDHLRRSAVTLPLAFEGFVAEGASPLEAIERLRDHLAALRAGPDPADVAIHPQPVDADVDGWVANADYASLGAFADALGAHRRGLEVRAERLDAGEAELAALDITDRGDGERPIVGWQAMACCLDTLAAEAGDPMALRRLWLDLGFDPAWVDGVRRGSITDIHPTAADALCEAVGATPDELFGPVVAGVHLGVEWASASDAAPPPAAVAAEQLVDAAGSLPAGELAVRLAAMSDDELAGVARALTERHGQLVVWEDHLAGREEALAAYLPSPSTPSLAVAPPGADVRDAAPGLGGGGVEDAASPPARVAMGDPGRPAGSDPPHVALRGHSASARLRPYEDFLPPAPFRPVDPALYEMRFAAGADDTVRAWLAAVPLAGVDPDAGLALRFAEGHLRRIHPELMASFDARRDSGLDPADAMAAAAVAAGVSVHRPGDLARAPAPIDQALADYVAAGDRRALCEVVQALGERRDDLWRWSVDVAARERALAPPLPPGPVTPAAVAGLVADLVADSGDDLATVSAGLGVDEAWVRAVLAGDVAEVDPARVAAMCASLDADPAELFGAPEPALVDHGVVPPPPTTAAQMMVDVGGFLRADELVVEVEALDAGEVAELVRAAATRHAQLEVWSDHLAGRERALAAVPAPVLPAAAVVAELAALVAETGDDVATVAINLGLAPQWAADLVAGRIDVVGLDDAKQLCDALDLDPLTTFGPPGAALAPDRWAVVPYDPFTAEAHVEPVEVQIPAPAVLDLGP